jgi:FkbM family methyltransferase
VPNATGPFGLDILLKRAVAPYTPTVLKTRTEPPFWIAVYRRHDGLKEQGVDGTWDPLGDSVYTHGLWDMHDTDIFYKVLKNQCNSGKGLVVDVGGHCGYFTILAAMQGCRVHVWEGSPRHATMIHLNVWLNGLSDRVVVHNNICGTGSAPLVFSGVGMEGHVSGSYAHSDNAEFLKTLGSQYANKTKGEQASGLRVYPLAIDDVVDEEVMLMKVDVEGYEPHVFNSARKLLQRGMVRYVVFEYNMWRAMTIEEGVKLVTDLLNWGYSVSRVPSSHCAIEHFRTAEDVFVLSKKLHNQTDACHRYALDMVATRRDMPQLFKT